MLAARESALSLLRQGDNSRAYLNLRSFKQVDSDVNCPQQRSVAKLVKLPRIRVTLQHTAEQDVEVLLPLGRTRMHTSDGLSQGPQQSHAGRRVFNVEQVVKSIGLAGVGDHQNPVVNIVSQQYRPRPNVLGQRRGELVGHNLPNQRGVIKRITRCRVVLNDNRTLLKHSRRGHLRAEHHRRGRSRQFSDVIENDVFAIALAQ